MKKRLFRLFLLAGIKATKKYAQEKPFMVRHFMVRQKQIARAIRIVERSGAL